MDTLCRRANRCSAAVGLCVADGPVVGAGFAGVVGCG
jgi:hypothetical protein